MTEEVVEVKESTRASLDLLYHISRELASALELRTVLHRVLMLALDSINGISGSIVVLDDKGDPIDSAIVYQGNFHRQTTTQLQSTLENGLAGWVVENRESALLVDTSLDERWEKRPDDAPDRTGAKSAVSAPLIAREQLVGVITLVHPEPGTYTEEHLALIQSIAEMAGIAVLNARLYSESQRQARVMTALAEISVSITAALGAEDILQRILEQVNMALRVEAVSLWLVDQDNNELEIVAATGPGIQSDIGHKITMGAGIAGWVAQEGKGIVVPRVKDDPLYNADVDRRTGLDTQSISCAPIRAQGKTIGVLEAFNPIERSLDSDTLLVLTGIGSLAGSVIQHAQLFERLQDAHQSFLELFEDSIDPIVITDWNGNLVQVNRRAAVVIGIDKETLHEMTVYELHDVDLNKVGGVGFDNLSSHESVMYGSQLRCKEGEIPIEVYVRQVEFQEEEHLQWILRDISERKRLDTLRDDLISMIYHDLRSPLANVIYSMDVLDSMLPENETYKSLIDVATRSTDRIQRLTSSLLDLKWLESGQEVAKRKPSPLYDILEYAIQAVTPIAESKQQAVITEFSNDLPEVPMDADMIRRVVINLLENSVKYSPLEGQITLGAGLDSESVRVWVKDTGPGIPDENQDHIFNKFARLNSGEKGIGLGLAFCRMAVEGHGGKIWVESEDEQGSCFTFTLPLTIEE